MPLWKWNKADDEDVGETLSPDAVGGGGHGGERTALQEQLRVSKAIRLFLSHHGVLSAEDVESDTPSPALREMLQRPHAVVPPELLDDSHPLTEYFISSSHNTYLLAHQLFGKSCPSSYETTLRAGAKCVEIDAWDNTDDLQEPKVTHGYTLVSNTPFRKVCETIRDYWDNDKSNPKAPIFLSLENHCGGPGQERLVAIMREVFGHRLLDDCDDHSETSPQLSRLEGKIAVIVEYHWPDAESQAQDDEGSSSSSSSDSEDDAVAKKQYEARKEDAPASPIISELARLGVYAQSVKPTSAGWYDLALDGYPHHHLINLSEVGLGTHLPANCDKVRAHNAQYLMRVYPKGTRVNSSNLNPVPFWHVGAQICALNWQRFGASLQLNEAMFTHSNGYILKPTYMRKGHVHAHSHGQHADRSNPKYPFPRRKLALRVVGATDVPERKDGIKPYISCQLVCGTDTGKPEKRKTGKYNDHDHLKFLNEVGADQYNPIWDETLEWEYDDDELVFLRILLKSDDKFARNPVIAAACIRLLYAQPGWHFVRLMDAHGQETKSTVFIKLDISDA
ncbi:phosphatidylinositol-specific phospholipase C [Trichosporon asahii var. asahii CBS 8904]|uniref:Phosphoinositide phospholipase C n=1 Tax=Trichosporon asahii var. asahii (strain CBS 8904) TaxID=1220162 RepID=K1V4M8_TRIAC|nr:phosphatidylinositol-specific phospholipase C [Trichosporon asahii var. asahii CBS 8904]